MQMNMRDHGCMARQRDLALLAHGVHMWNESACKPGHGRADLTGASLAGARLDGINFRAADLSGANLQAAKLRGADLTDAVLDGADLAGALLQHAVGRAASMKKARLSRVRAVGATLEAVEFTDSDLSDGDFTDAKLTNAIFRRTNLSRTNLTRADLRYAVFYYGVIEEAVLRYADVSGAYFGGMTVNDVDLSSAVGLSTIEHRAPSFVSFGTVRLNPTADVLSFLRSCGLNEIEATFGKLWGRDVSVGDVNDIVYEISRLRTAQPIMVNPLFISYSHADAEFVERLISELETNGLRCWRDVKNLTVGRVDTQIDRAIRLNPIVLLVLSKASVRSDWVAWEAATARRVEQQGRRSVLCPIALDDAWKTCEWSAPLRHQIESYHLLDFSGWRETKAFRVQFGRLLEGLRLYYSGA